MKATEVADAKKEKKAGSSGDEYVGYTPLQLAIVSPHYQFESIQMLVEAGADTTVLTKNTGNNILHLSLIHSKNLNLINYLLQDVKIDIFQRNKKEGQTAMDLATALNNKEAMGVINWELELHSDKTNAAADSLFDDLD